MPVTAVRVTPIAFRDPPLLNVAGVHEPWALRSVIEVETGDGLVGLGESYGEESTLADLNAIAPSLVGLDPFDLNGLIRAVHARFAGGGDPAAPYPAAGDKARGLRGRLPRPAGPADRTIGGRAPRRRGPRSRPLQRLPVLQVRAPQESRPRGRSLGRGPDPRPDGRRSAPHDRRIRLRLAEAE